MNRSACQRYPNDINLRIAHNEGWRAARALLATGGQAQAVKQAPVLYVSKGQLDNHRDPDGPDSANAGRYLPARITPAGNFTMPLFAAPKAQAVPLKLIEAINTACGGNEWQGDAVVTDLLDPACRAIESLAPQAQADLYKAKADRYDFIVEKKLILSGGTEQFGWPIAPFGSECDRYIDAAIAAAKEGAQQQ